MATSSRRQNTIVEIELQLKNQTSKKTKKQVASKFMRQHQSLMWLRTDMDDKGCVNDLDLVYCLSKLRH